MGLRHSSLVKPKIWVLKGDRSDTAATKPREGTDGVKSTAEVAAEPRRQNKRLHHVHPHRRPHRRPRSRGNPGSPSSRFGYQITDVDAFLTKASLDNPANIPVVLSSTCLLYQTRLGGFQEELSLPLGMVVNAVFKNQTWLYVQTPHGEEGYVRYTSCLPLGILPPRTPAPCWETHTDIFPMPLGNRLEGRGGGTRSECGGMRPRKYDGRDTVSACGERSVDKLYLKAAASSRDLTRRTLVVISRDYEGRGRGTLTVSKGDVVELVSAQVKDWFCIRTKGGVEGIIPAAVAGHGFL